MTDSGYELSRQQRAGWRAAARDHRVVARRIVGAEPDLESARERMAGSAALHEILRTDIVDAASRSEPVQAVRASGPHAVELEVRPVAAGWQVSLAVPALVGDAATAEALLAVALDGAAEAEDPIQYADYAAWQAELAAEDPQTAAAADAHWAGVGGPWSRPFAPALTAAGPDTPAEQAVPEEVAAAVAKLAAATGIDATAAWLAVWAAAVGQLTGDSPVRLGLELDARGDGELAGAAGPYTSVAPVVLELAADTTVEALAAAADAAHATAAAYLEFLPATHAGDAPFLLGRAAADTEVPRPGLLVELRLDPRDPAAAPVLRASADGAALLPDVLGVLAAVAGLHPEAYVLDAPVAPSAATRAAERGPELGATGTVLELIGAAAAARADQPALDDGERALSYAELARAVGTTAAAVRAAVPAGEPVGLLSDRTAAAVVGLLAVQVAGRACVPLDPAQPPARLRAQLAAAGVRTVVAPRPVELDLEVPTVAVSLEAGPDQRADWSGPQPGDLAYVIFTSGSTGQPKGVEVTHAALADYVTGLSTTLALEPMVWALASPLFTDLGHTALYGALATGGTVQLLSRDELLDPQLFGARVRDRGIEAAKLTPSQLSGLLGGDAWVTLPSRLLVLGGEALPWDLVDRVRQHCDARIVNHYGPTEATVGVLVHEVRATDERRGPTVPLGRPLPNAIATVRNRRQGLAPATAVGELLLGGPGLARGYRGDAERTAAAFVADPADLGRRLYRTGDLVGRDADGELYFLGRTDDQIKLRGYRVELGEIESALRQHPGVQRAAVAVDGSGDGATLAAYVVSHFHPSPTPAQLRAHLSELLPDYLIPTTFTDLPALPLGPSGKIDRAALPAPSSMAEHERFEAPQSAVEIALAGIYADLLGGAGDEQNPVGRHDDFFHLGGHSLLAAQVVMRIRRELSVEVPISAIFQWPVVADLAAQVEAQLIADSDDPELAQLLARLEGVSEDEAAALLAEHAREQR